MASRLSKGLGLGLLCAVGVSCGNPPDRQDFEVGDGRDPIVKRVQELGAGTMDTIDLTIKNGTGYGFTQGALLFSAPFTVNTAPSTAMINFVQDTSSSAGNATTFITATGATVGTTGFVVPAIAKGDVRPAGCGVRAQAMDRAGKLLDDFAFAEDENQLHVLNAPSPAATASLAIGRHLASKVLAGLREGAAT